MIYEENHPIYISVMSKLFSCSHFVHYAVFVHHALYMYIPQTLPAALFTLYGCLTIISEIHLSYNHV